MQQWVIFVLGKWKLNDTITTNLQNIVALTIPYKVPL